MSNLATMSRPRKLGPRHNLTKTKKQKQIPPVKVVYISNPMKVKTSASQFRALVQQLTGQDSELPADPTAYEDGDADKVNQVLVDEDDGNDVEQQQLRVSGESCLASSQPPERSSSTTTTSSSEVEEFGGGGACYADEFVMGNDPVLDNLLPVWGSEAFLCRWMC